MEGKLHTRSEMMGKFDVSNDIMHGGWGGGGGGGGAACLTEQLVTLGSYQPSLSLFGLDQKTIIFKIV